MARRGSHHYRHQGCESRCRTFPIAVTGLTETPIEGSGSPIWPTMCSKLPASRPGAAARPEHRLQSRSCLDDAEPDTAGVAGLTPDVAFYSMMSRCRNRSAI